MKLNILGVKIDNLSKEDVLERIGFYLKGENSHCIFTPNPEFVLKAQKDLEFQNILNKADICVPDGTGLVFASWWLKHLNLGQIIRYKERICGSDLVLDILKLAEEEKRSVFVLSVEPTLSSISEIKKVIAEKYPKLKIDGKILKKGDYDNREVLGYILGSQAEIVLVTFGAPMQEKWIWQNLALLPDVRLAMGVGGSFDFLTNKIRRAPNLIRKIGFEWIWRLLQEPKKRIKRIYNAFVVFTWKIFWLGLKTKLFKK